MYKEWNANEYNKNSSQGSHTVLEFPDSLEPCIIYFTTIFFFLKSIFFIMFLKMLNFQTRMDAMTSGIILRKGMSL